MIFDNPEFIRLKRAKLRPRTMVLLGAGSFLIFAGILIAMYMGETQWGQVPITRMNVLLERYFFIIAWLQLVVVSLYGLTLAAQSVSLERERSTMDFQRLIGMGPWRLAAGKLFGAPI